MPLKDWAKTLKRDAIALWIAARDGRTSLAARLLAGAVAAYALSPIDLIPDFIPVLGLLDDLVLLPLGIWLVLRLIPPALMEAYRREAAERVVRPVSRTAAIGIVALWLAAALGTAWPVLRA